MKSTLMSFAIAVALAASAAHADVSVCVNDKTGKARFAATCSKKETQQFLSTGGVASGDVRTISKKVVVPKGTVPGHRISSTSSAWTPNFVAELSCSDQELYLESRQGMEVIGAYPDNHCDAAYPADEEEQMRFVRMQVYCGGGSSSYDEYGMATLAPTTKDISLYLYGACIKK